MNPNEPEGERTDERQAEPNTGTPVTRDVPARGAPPERGDPMSREEKERYADEAPSDE